MVAISGTVTGSTPPVVSVTVTAPPAGLVTIERGVAGVWTPVRGAESIVSSNPMTVLDYEAPPATSLTYRVYPAGAPGSATTSSSVTITAPPCLWLVSLANPTTASVRPRFWHDAGYQVPTLTSSVSPLPSRPGDTVSPVVATAGLGTRQGSATFRTTSAADEAKLLALMGQPVWVSHNPTHIFGPAYVVLGNPQVVPVVKKGSAEDRTFSMDFIVVDRPTVSSSGVVTWLDVAGRYATWNDLAAAYPTWDAFLADAATWAS